MEAKSEIKEFYKGRTIFITGMSGFIGKVLIWKLLNDCPLIDKIYVLLRPKRNETVNLRLDNILKCIMYDSIREKNARLLEKVVAVAGDIGENKLNISSVDEEILLNEVSIVFHAAASLNMDAQLKDAVNMNIKGTIRMLELCSKMKKLESFIHVSTAYCYCDKEVTEEEVISNVNPNDVIQAVDWLSSSQLQKITPDIIKPHPNTYAYTKRITEKIVADYYPSLPVIITRPSIVIPSLKEPIPGWVDNMNGPVGLVVAGGKGVMRSLLADSNAVCDLIPVDIVCNGLIAVACYTVLELKQNRPKSIPVVNLTSTEVRPLTCSQVLHLGMSVHLDYPLDNILWHPGLTITTNEFLHYLIAISFQWIPAYFLDFLLTLCGQKPFLVFVQKKLARGQKVFQYFITRNWKFSTRNILKIKEQMNATDREIFPVTNAGLVTEESKRELLINAGKMTKVVILKESIAEEDLNRCKRKAKILYLVDLGVKLLSVIFAAWFVITWLRIKKTPFNNMKI